CLVLESDFLLSGELEFGDSEIMGYFSSFLPGVGLDLGTELYCLSCEEGVQHAASFDSSLVNGSNLSDTSISGGSNRKRRSLGKSGAAGDVPAKLFSCPQCVFTTRYSNHLKRHMKTHDGQKPYHCPVCPYASAQLVNLQRHARTHTGEKPYRCHQCSYACSSLGNLRRHQRMHTQERPQRREKEKRRGRRKKANAEAEEEKFSGSLIIDRVKITTNLMIKSLFPFSPARRPTVVSDLTLRVSQDSGFLHTLGGLGSPSAPLPVLLFPLCCRLCGLTLEEADLEEDKMCRRCALDLLSKDGPGPPCGPAVSRGSRRGQRGTKLYRCPHCPFLSHYPNHLARHAHTHSEEKPHRCPHCAYTSSHLDNLKRHLRVHTGEKPYQCPACSYACGNLANLRRHERIHSGTKPFHCGVCGYSCNQSMNLKRHMLRHTGEKPYACAECSYTTGHWDNYKRHQRKHGHNTDSWDKHAPINGLSWSKDTQEGESQGQEHT
uniref:Zinc finger protein 513 n=1 Tax=Scophthalmus maximus TaxID=52904 RepID=A0A8D2ZMZ6_SCOMX